MRSGSCYTAKERAGAYGGFRFDSRAVTADADKATISVALEFSENERRFLKDVRNQDCPPADEIIVEMPREGGAKTVKGSRPVTMLLSSYARRVLHSPGFFDYFDAYRQVPKTDVTSWDANLLTDDRAKKTLGAVGPEKFQLTKQYLLSLKMQDFQQWQNARAEGRDYAGDSLQPIRAFFDRFFAPMRFVDVRCNAPRFEFVVATPMGEVDLDDLSSGEKEVLSTFIRFDQMQPQGAVILLDEADAHLHPDLQRRYLQELRELGAGNQIWITTHSPEMMIEAGSDSLYTILKEPSAAAANQFLRVTTDDELHDILSEVMGSRGLVSS